ncbi:hypothetical protein [Microbacterium indicum]|uniref:hypothetical protein n=1 Tax=Microbacterium indicum TaxID=358100 RepID=UPI00040CA842|nr:hypothetical protein [Microbacterium indicum]
MSHPSPGAPRRRAGWDLAVIVLLLLMTFAAIGASFLALNREFWSAGAFAERYVETLADADASAALAIPGVAPEVSELRGIGEEGASEVLLRSATLTGEFDDVRVTRDRVVDGGVHEVTVAYTLDGSPGETTFRVEQTGSAGLVPEWAFETSPLAVIDLTVRGSWRFSVADFEVDERQISPDGVDANGLDPVSMLVFAPGSYAISVDTAATTADPVTATAEDPMGVVSVDVQTEPTDQLRDVVQNSVEQYLTDTCTTQAVLQPSGCPFSYDASWGWAQDDIEWSITSMPRTKLVPDGDSWKVSPASGTAHVTLTVQDYFTGSLIPIDEDVYFTMVADVHVRDDGVAAIDIDRA